MATAIQEANNLSILAIEELLGSLKVHELELRQEGADRRGESITLKAHKGSTSKALKADDLVEESCGLKEKKDQMMMSHPSSPRKSKPCGRRKVASEKSNSTENF